MCNDLRARSEPITRAYKLLWVLACLGLLWTLAPPARGAELHEPFHRVLVDHVDNGRVDYADIARDPRFDEYLSALASTDPGLNGRDERLAYWINAYNAFAIEGILDGASPSSFFGRIGYFRTRSYTAGGERINLYDLEHDVLIPVGEPRIHFAIVCASMSCPELRSEAYTAAKLDSQLDTQARNFINDETKNRFDREAKVAHLSKIFDWFEEDFVEHSGSVLDYVARYVNDPRLAKELESGTYVVRYLDYDWSLNGIPPGG